MDLIKIFPAWKQFFSHHLESAGTDILTSFIAGENPQICPFCYIHTVIYPYPGLNPNSDITKIQMSKAT